MPSSPPQGPTIMEYALPPADPTPPNGHTSSADNASAVQLAVYGLSSGVVALASGAAVATTTVVRSHARVGVAVIAVVAVAVSVFAGMVSHSFFDFLNNARKRAKN